MWTVKTLNHKEFCEELWIYEFIDVFLQTCRKREGRMDLLLSVINDLVTHNLYNLSTITFCFLSTSIAQIYRYFRFRFSLRKLLQCFLFSHSPSFFPNVLHAMFIFHIFNMITIIIIIIIIIIYVLNVVFDVGKQRTTSPCPDVIKDFWANGNMDIMSWLHREHTGTHVICPGFIVAQIYEYVNVDI